VLTDCTREVADLKRLELQGRIAAIELDVRPGTKLRFGVSAGAAVFPHDGTTYEELLADADHLMYRDKAARRGQSPLANVPASDFIPAEVHEAAVGHPALALRQTPA
jgi:predicted signal transduction protein with EAL and GGDEF domain